MNVRRGGSFDETAFFSRDMAEITKRTLTQHQSLFELAYDLNSFAQGLKFECDVKNRDYQALMAIGLYFRVLDAFSSAIILCENSLGQDAEAMTRVGMEAMFFMKAIAEDESFAKEFIKSDQKRRLTLLNVASQPNSSLHELFEKDSDNLDEIRQKVKEEVETEQIMEQKAIDVAIKAGLQAHYDYAYRILSQSVHPTPRSLSDYFKFSEDDEVTDILYPQEKDAVPTALFTSISNMLMAAKILVGLFEIKCDGIEKFEARFKEYDGHYARGTGQHGY